MTDDLRSAAQRLDSDRLALRLCQIAHLVLDRPPRLAAIDCVPPEEAELWRQNAAALEREFCLSISVYDLAKRLYEEALAASLVLGGPWPSDEFSQRPWLNRARALLSSLGPEGALPEEEREDWVLWYCEQCSSCKGTGIDDTPTFDKEQCSRCDGTGVLAVAPYAIDRRAQGVSRAKVEELAHQWQHANGHPEYEHAKQSCAAELRALLGAPEEET